MATTPASISHWNTAGILRIRLDCRVCPCVGHARREGRQCRLIIAESNRLKAVDILQAMSEQDVHTTDFDSSLKSLARLVLCQRWHVKDNTQIEAKVRQWKRKIERYRAAENARLVQLPVVETSTTDTSNPPHTRALIETVESLRQEVATLKQNYADLLQLVNSTRIGSSGLPQPIHPTDSTSTSSVTERSTLEQQNENTSPYTTAPPAGSSEHEVTQSGLTQDPAEIPLPISRESTVEPESPPPEPISHSSSSNDQLIPEAAPVEHTNTEPDSLRLESIFDSLSLNDQITPDASPIERSNTEPGHPPSESISNDQITREASPIDHTNTVSGHQSVSQRLIEEKCSICLEDMNHEQSLSWCRSQCGQSFHANCIGIWHVGQEDSGSAQNCPRW